VVLGDLALQVIINTKARVMNKLPNCRRSIYNDELCEALFIFRRTAAASRVLEVKVKAVELPLSKELDASLYELGPTGCVSQHRCHLGDAEVPAADCQ